ncbi:hypothetical protein [Deinococcus sp. UYEF24]
MINKRTDWARFIALQEGTVRVLSLELRRLQEHAAWQEQRLAEMEKRTRLTWPGQPSFPQFEIEP